jgi:hypothetical protein
VEPGRSAMRTPPSKPTSLSVPGGVEDRPVTLQGSDQSAETSDDASDPTTG